MSTRKITFFERDTDLMTLARYRFRLNVAMRVASVDGKVASNVVWRSLPLAPYADVSWNSNYALNWTPRMPSEGAVLTVSGNWQPYVKGQSFDINHLGLWTPSASPGNVDPDSFNVGNIGYQYPGSPTIHIIVGILSAETQRYEPIFIDPVDLPLNSSAKYRPLESVSAWWSANSSSAVIYQAGKYPTAEIDATSATRQGKFEWWATYQSTQGEWAVSDSPPS